MKKVYHLSSCDTCKKIIKMLEVPDDVTLQDIKNEPLTETRLTEMHKLSGSYEKLFSKRARLYKERNLKAQKLTETDYKNLLLEHYTFLSRPVVIAGNQIFIGNSPKTVAEAKQALHSKQKGISHG